MLVLRKVGRMCAMRRFFTFRIFAFTVRRMSGVADPDSDGSNTDRRHFLRFGRTRQLFLQAVAKLVNQTFWITKTIGLFNTQYIDLSITFRLNSVLTCRISSDYAAVLLIILNAAIPFSSVPNVLDKNPEYVRLSNGRLDNHQLARSLDLPWTAHFDRQIAQTSIVS